MTKQQVLSIDEVYETKRKGEKKKGKAWPASQACSVGAAAGYGCADYRPKIRIPDVPKSS